MKHCTCAPSVKTGAVFYISLRSDRAISSISLLVERLVYNITTRRLLSTDGAFQFHLKDSHRQREVDNMLQWYACSTTKHFDH